MPTIPYKNKEGKRISGVTTIISANLGWNKEQLMWWANEEGLAGRRHRETSQAAADAGTIAHAMIEAHLKNVVYEIPKETDVDVTKKAQRAFDNFLHWKEMVNMKVISLEEHLVSEEYQFGATPDCIAEINDKICLFDWKSSNNVYSDYQIQIAAYKVAWEENHPDIPIEGGFYLYRMDKNEAAWTLHYWEYLTEAWEAFLLLLGLHKLHKKLK